jgi:hypothetical protein
MVGELLASIRDLYTNQFADLVACGGGLSEVALRNRKGEPIREGSLGLPMRLDLVTFAGGIPQSRSVDPEMVMRFEPVSFEHSGLSVLLYPFQWDDVAISFEEPADLDLRPLLEWFAEWYREDDDGDGELLGVVHSLSTLETTNGTVRFTADLGSAPVEAFDALLDAIAALGVKSVVVG